MSDELREVVGALPEGAFREPEGRFASLSPLQRLRWLQETACFVWKYKGVARRWVRDEPESVRDSSAEG